MNGLSERDILARFDPATFAALGYTDALRRAGSAWPATCSTRPTPTSPAGTCRWSGAGTFMLTDNHPSVIALVQLARQVAELLGASAERIAFPGSR